MKLAGGFEKRPFSGSLKYQTAWEYATEPECAPGPLQRAVSIAG